MLHRLRLAMKTETFQRLDGEVEADETYIGGSQTNKRHPRLAKGRKASGPQAGRVIVMGMKQRGGEVRAFVVPDTRRRRSCRPFGITSRPGSKVYTDSLGSYTDLREGLCAWRHQSRQRVRAATKFTRTRLRTSGAFLSARSVARTSRRARGHLDAYLDEQIFRFNEREKQRRPALREGAQRHGWPSGNLR